MDIFWTFYLNHLSPLWGYFTDCKNIYKSMTSFRAHKRNNQCYILEEDIEDEDVPEQSQEPME